MKHHKRQRTTYLLDVVYREWVGSHSLYGRQRPMASNGAGGTGSWAHKTPVDILADINAMLELCALPAHLTPQTIEFYGLKQYEEYLKLTRRMLPPWPVSVV